MKKLHEQKSGRVSEPVQVYLDSADRARLDRMSADLNSTKSDVLRRALEALEQQLTDPESHPAIRMIGLAGVSGARNSATRDVAIDHDKYLAEQEIASWRKPRAKKRGA